VIVLLRHGAPAGDVREFVDAVRALGLEVVPLDDRRGRGFEILGAERGKVLALRGSPAVAEILTRRTALAGGEPLWPHFFLRFSALGLAVLAALLLVAAWLPPQLAEAAPGAGDGGVDWYLRPLAAFLAFFPGAFRPLGGTLFLLFWGLFIFWPFLDRAEPSGRTAKLVRVMGVLLLLLMVLLGARGAP
jgi:hypothetical protein